jgi:hypothetical protein
MPNQYTANPVPTVSRRCANCGAAFDVPPSTVKFHPAKYCSQACYRAGSRKPVADRFWALVRKSPDPDGCWEWVGRIAKDGYGQLRAHRFAWTLLHGPIPEGQHVLHKCDNRKCVRHTFLGTQQDNMDDMVSKGRSATGERNGMRRHPERHHRGPRTKEQS